jgi:hypothetical protein
MTVIEDEIMGLVRKGKYLKAVKALFTRALNKIKKLTITYDEGN